MAAGSIIIDLLLKTGSFETDSRKAEKSWRNFEKSVSTGAANMAKAIGFTSLTLGGLAGSISLWAKDMANMGAEINRLSRIANSSTQDFQRWGYATKTVGIEQDKLSDILKDVNDKAGEFLSTGGGAMKDFFEQVAPKVGVTAEQFRRLSGTQGLQLYYDSLEKAGLSQKQMTFYLEALANDATALTPLLANNGRELKRLGEEADRLGVIMEDSTIAAAVELKHNLDLLLANVKGLSITLGNDAIPMLNASAKAFMNADNKTSGLHGSLKDIAKDSGFKNWLREAILMVATTADEIERLTGLFQGLSGSFKVVAADMQYSKAWADAKLVPPGMKRSNADQAIYDAILAGADGRRTNALNSANSGYAAFSQGKGADSYYSRAKRALDELDSGQKAISSANQSVGKELKTTGTTLQDGNEKVKKAIEDFSKGLRIKAGANAAGSANQGTYAAAHILQQAAGKNLRWFSSFNDNYHKGSNSKHAKGLAFDATFTNGQKGAAEAINNLTAVLSRLGFKQGKDYSLIDEYRNPSKRSTGGHLHFQWADQANADKFAQFQKGGIAGNELANVEAINTEYARYIDRLSESRAMLGQETELAKLNAQIKLGMFAELSPAQQDTMRQLAGMYDQEQALFDLRSKMKDLQSEYNNAMQFGMPFDEQGALTELYQNNLVALQNYYDAQMTLSADNEERLQQLRLQYAQDTGRMLESYNLQSQSLTLATTGEFFGQMGDLVKAFGGEQSSAYRSMLMVQKAANLASVLMSGYKAIAEAYASAPFPANIPAVAAATVKTGVLSAAVQAITPAFADGGHVVGAGTGRSDSIPALLSNGEFVINAQATAKNRSLLEAINSNRYADGGIVGSGQWDKGRKSGTQVNVGDVHVNIENGGGDSEIDAAQAKQLGHAIKNAVREEIAKQARPGGILAQRG